MVGNPEIEQKVLPFGGKQWSKVNLSMSYP